jgi:hypothetical protein
MYKSYPVKLRKRWPWNPLFGHLGDEILKSMKKRITMDFNGNLV